MHTIIGHLLPEGVLLGTFYKKERSIVGLDMENPVGQPGAWMKILEQKVMSFILPLALFRKMMLNIFSMCLSISTKENSTLNLKDSS